MRTEESNTVTLLCQCPQSVNYSDGFCFCEYRSLCAGSNVAKERWNILLCPQMPDIAQTNPWLMTRSVPGPGDLRENLGKLVEQMMCSLSQLVNTLTTYGGGILTTDKHSPVIRHSGLWQKCYVILIELNLGPNVTISIRLWRIQSWRRNYKKFTSTKCTNIKNITTVFLGPLKLKMSFVATF